MIHTRLFSFNPLGTNCVVSWASGSSTCTVIDPGMSSEDGVEQLSLLMKEHGLVPDAILLTHGHFDHVWGVQRFLARYKVPIYMHPSDKEILADGATVFRGMQSFSQLKHGFPTLDLTDGERISTGGIQWQVLHTPGHTPGSVCFYSPENSLLLSGDTLFAGSIGRTDLLGGDYDTLMRSIRERLLCLPGETDVIPGHGQPTSIAREGMYNPFLEPFNEPLED